MTIKKILVANRSEIAIRIFRAAEEIGIKTAAIYSKEDRFALHRFKTNESYLVGKDKGPIQAYLDIKSIINIAKDIFDLDYDDEYYTGCVNIKLSSEISDNIYKIKESNNNELVNSIIKFDYIDFTNDFCNKKNTKQLFLKHDPMHLSEFGHKFGFELLKKRIDL